MFKIATCENMGFIYCGDRNVQKVIEAGRSYNFFLYVDISKFTCSRCQFYFFCGGSQNFLKSSFKLFLVRFQVLQLSSPSTSM